ncbi:hypothetical protein QE152_g12491 [Popillia japonica]|uniref:Uncharacterized protein n=1 Tax=Popillia japonica TaxID=7064 RepID=A0AAW1LIX4_POPJA
MLQGSEASDNSTEMDVSTANKRKRSTLNKKSREMTEFLWFMEKLCNKTDGIRKMVKESTKTKTEIKTMTRELVDIVGALKKKVDALKLRHDILTAKCEKQSALVRTPKSVSKMANSKLQYVMEMLNTKNDFDSLEGVIDSTWPEAVYKATEVRNVTLYDMVGEHDMALFMKPNTKGNANALEPLICRCPAVRSLLEDDLVEGQIEFVKVRTEVTSSRRNKKDLPNQKSVYLLPVKINDGGFEDMQNIFKMCRKLKKEVAIKKFPEIDGCSIYFTDSCGTIIEEDVFVDYVKHSKNSNQPMEFIVLRQNDEHRSIDSRSTTSVISVDNAPLKGISSFYCGDNISNISMNSLGDIEVLNEEIENMESTIENEIDYLESSIEGDIDKEIDLNDNIVTECRNSVNITSKSQIITHVHEKDSEFSSIFRNTSLDGWKSIICEKGGEEIFNEYKAKKIISNRLRVKLVNIMCSILVEKYGIKVPGKEKEEAASLIIKLIPGLRDPLGKTGYEAFYTNRNGGEGYIAWRLRTIARNHYSGKVIRKRKNKSPVDTLTRKQQNVIVKTPEISEALEYLKNANSNDMDGILEKMSLTYTYRRTLKEDIWKEFPRFEDLPYLIENDFKLAGYDDNFETMFEGDIEKVLSIYMSTVRHHHSEIIRDGKKHNINRILSWSRSIKAILALAHMLPPPAIYRSKYNNNTVLDNHIFVFKSVNTPISEIVEVKKANYPFLLVQGEIMQECDVQNNAKCTVQGTYLSTNQLFLNKKYFIQLQLYYDDFETANPLGSKAGIHKMGAFYFTIKNFFALNNSNLDQIYLVALFFTQDIKESGVTINTIMKPLIDDVKILETHGIIIPGLSDCVFATIISLSHDNLAANCLHGMVECFQANHYCRFCLNHKSELQTMCSAKSAVLRNGTNYEEHSLVASETNPIYGIKRRSLLNDLQYFKLCESLSVDIMHDILEGVVPLEIKLLIVDLVKNNVIPLDNLNERIRLFNYGELNRCVKPGPIMLEKRGNLIGQNAAQSWCLVRFLPLILNRDL